MRSHKHVNSTSCLRQKDSRLAGGVPTANDNQVLQFAELCLYERRAVVDALSNEPLQIQILRVVVLSSAGNHNATRFQRFAVFQYESVGVLVTVQLDYGMGNHQLGPEFLCLGDRACSELFSRKASREPEVVFNLRA